MLDDQHDRGASAGFTLLLLMRQFAGLCVGQPIVQAIGGKSRNDGPDRLVAMLLDECATGLSFKSVHMVLVDSLFNWNGGTFDFELAGAALLLAQSPPTD